MNRPFLAASLLGFLLVSGCANTAPSGQGDPNSGEVQEIKIGVIGPMSGDAAAYGEEMQKVLSYALPEVNEKYKTKGYQFELVYEDSKCTGADAVTAFQKLTDINGVEFIIGGFCSSESLGIAPLLESKNVLALSAGSSNPQIEGKSPYLFSLSYSDEGVGQAIAKELSQYKKVAMITEQNDYNQGIKNVVEATLKNYPEVQIVANEQFEKGGTEFRNQLQKIKATEPDVLFFNPNPGVTTEALAKQFAEIQDWPVEKVSQFAFLGESIMSIAALNGTLVIDAPTVNATEFLAYREEIIGAKGSLDNLGNYYTASTLDALYLMAELIAESNGDPVQAQQNLSTGTFQGRLGTLSFKGNSFVQGIGVAQFRLEKGKAVQVNE